ncbi:hypothetical protein LINGRAHAP2_LOCUS11265 [Linum grandiflorum]
MLRGHLQFGSGIRRRGFAPRPDQIQRRRWNPGEAR